MDLSFTSSSTVDDIQYDNEDEEDDDGVMMNPPNMSPHFTHFLEQKISILLKPFDTRSSVYAIIGFQYLKREELP